MVRPPASGEGIGGPTVKAPGEHPLTFSQTFGAADVSRARRRDYERRSVATGSVLGEADLLTPGRRRTSQMAASRQTMNVVSPGQ